MPQPSYAYGVARVRALETRLLTKDRIERMLDAAAEVDALKVLSDTEYGLGLAGLDASSHDYETILKAELRRISVLIRSISPAPEVTDLFLLKYDFHNLKVLFKARHLEIDGGYMLIDAGTVPLEVLKAAVLTGSYLMLPAFMRAAVEEIQDMLSVKVDPQKIDLKLDRAMFVYIFTVCKRLNDDFIVGYFERLIDLINIKSVLRIKRMGEGAELLKEVLIPYGTWASSFYIRALEETYEQLLDSLSYTRYGSVVTEGIQDLLKNGSLTLLEKMADDYMFDYVKKSKHNTFGIEPIVGYLLAKENEIRLIRTIMVGKANNIPNDRIRERLRELYG